MESLTPNQQTNTITTTEQPLSINPEQYCKYHEKQIVDMYCYECDDVFCAKCALANHREHILSDLTIKKGIISKRNNEVNEAIVKVKEQIDLNKKEINLQFNELHEELDKKKENLLLEVDKIGNEKIQSLQNENQLLNECHNNLNSICQFSDGNNKKRKLEKELNNLHELKVLNNLNEMNEFKLNINEDKNNLINTKFGNIQHKEIKNDKLLFNNKNYTTYKVLALSE
ncbi:hypothetical protein ABK040_016640 [Willaertia magna]